MESNEPLTPRPTRSGNERTFAIISLVLGIFNLCAWLFPICGFPLCNRRGCAWLFGYEISGAKEFGGCGHGPFRFGASCWHVPMRLPGWCLPRK